jgi:aquaporin Z
MSQRRAAAEFVGTFVLVLVGLGAALIGGEAIGLLGIGLAFGLALVAMAYAIGPVSGCHINPAVTLGLLLDRRIDRDEAVRYWIAQVLGGFAATVVLVIILKAREGGYELDGAIGANGWGDHSPGGYNLLATILVEVLLTGLLVFTVLAATSRIANTAFAGLPIGLVLVAMHYVGVPVDGLSANPARSIGPAIFEGGWALGQLVVFIAAPLLGGVLAATLYRFLFDGMTPVPPEESAVAAT